MYGFSTGLNRRGRNKGTVKNAGNRKVFPSREVYHLWANEAQEHARNSSDSVSFDGAKAYSYRAVIGEIVRNAAGQRAYLIATRTWSVTTSGHQSALRQSVPDGETVFHVYDFTGELDHERNLAAYTDSMAASMLKYKRASKRKDWYLTDLQDTKAEAERYCEFFSLENPLANQSVDEFIAAKLPELEEAAKQERAAQRERNKQARERLARQAEQWKAGTGYSLPYNYPDVLLRLTPDGSEIETSKGARVPVTHGLRLYRKLQAGKLAAGDQAGHYRVTRLQGSTVIIGCHHITRAEIERFASVAGWTAVQS